MSSSHSHFTILNFNQLLKTYTHCYISYIFIICLCDRTHIALLRAYINIKTGTII